MRLGLGIQYVRYKCLQKHLFSSTLTAHYCTKQTLIIGTHGWTWRVIPYTWPHQKTCSLPLFITGFDSREAAMQSGAFLAESRTKLWVISGFYFSIKLFFTTFSKNNWQFEVCSSCSFQMPKINVSRLMTILNFVQYYYSWSQNAELEPTKKGSTRQF